jgi:hypothetical protein
MSTVKISGPEKSAAWSSSPPRGRAVPVPQTRVTQTRVTSACSRVGLQIATVPPLQGLDRLHRAWLIWAERHAGFFDPRLGVELGIAERFSCAGTKVTTDDGRTQTCTSDKGD